VKDVQPGMFRVLISAAYKETGDEWDPNHEFVFCGLVSQIIGTNYQTLRPELHRLLI
jgi:hypothetical protein